MLNPSNKKFLKGPVPVQKYDMMSLGFPTRFLKQETDITYTSPYFRHKSLNASVTCKDLLRRIIAVNHSFHNFHHFLFDINSVRKVSSTLLFTHNEQHQDQNDNCRQHHSFLPPGQNSASTTKPIAFSKYQNFHTIRRKKHLNSDF